MTSKSTSSMMTEVKGLALQKMRASTECGELSLRFEAQL